MTTPHVDGVSPGMATNDVATTLVVNGRDFLRPLAVTLTGAGAPYQLPVLASSPLAVTAVITPGLPAGEYRVTVTNLHNALSPTSLPFALYSAAPSGVCFYDFFASGSAKWQRSGAWDVVTIPSGEQAMTDSPAGNYDSAVPPVLTATTSITSLPFNLADCPQPALTFRHDYVLAKIGTSQDLGRVELTTDDGQTWHELARYTGGGIYGDGARPAAASGEWAEVKWKAANIDLGAYTGTARLRFSLEVDRTASDKGWIIDDVQVRSALSARTYLPLLLR